MLIMMGFFRLNKLWIQMKKQILMNFSCKTLTIHQLLLIIRTSNLSKLFSDLLDDLLNKLKEGLLENYDYFILPS